MVRYRLNLLLLALVLGLLAGAWSLDRNLSEPNYEPLVEGQMARSPAYGSFAPNPNFADGSTLRSPPAGTVIRGQQPLGYEASPESAVRAARELRNPYTETEEARLLRGGVEHLAKPE